MRLAFGLKMDVCGVIMDTGFLGSADDYVRAFYGKPFEELTETEARLIVETLGPKPGCLAEVR